MDGHSTKGAFVLEDHTTSVGAQLNEEHGFGFIEEDETREWV